MESNTQKGLSCYTVLDLETTGLDPKKDKIIEIGAVRVIDGEVFQTCSMLVRPGRRLSETVTKLTGITDDMIETEGVSSDKAVKELLDFLSGDILLGHCILFDFSFVKRMAVNHRLTYEAQGVDTLKLARYYLPDLPSRSLPALCEHYKIQRKSHRALEDAYATMELYQHLCEQYYDPKTFAPQNLIYQVKRESPSSIRQQDYLRRLLMYHGIEPDFTIESLSKNEASRYTDHIILAHGRMPKETGSTVDVKRDFEAQSEHL